MFEMVMLLGFLYIGLIHLLPPDSEDAKATQARGGSCDASSYSHGNTRNLEARKRPDFRQRTLSRQKARRIAPFEKGRLHPFQNNSDMLLSGRFLQGGAEIEFSNVLNQTATDRRSP
jgi:hypothetical protein